MFYLVCSIAVPDYEFAILGGADQKPEQKENHLDLKTDKHKKKKLNAGWIKPI